jgi:hypothetical protein
MVEPASLEPAVESPPAATPRSASSRWLELGVWNVAGAFLALLAPHLVLLAHHSYSLTSPEAAALWVVLLLAAVLVAVVSWTSRGIWRAVVFSLLLVSCAETMGGLPEGWRLRWLAAGILVACLLLRKELPKVVVAVFAVFNATTCAQSSFRGEPAPPSATVARLDLPIVVHLVLDAHEGLDALAATARGAELRDALLATQERHGFRVYGAAYSRYLLTKNSLANMLNFSAKRRSFAHFERETSPRLLENAYFDRLLEQGFSLRVLQSDYLDFCAGSRVSASACASYPHSGLEVIQAIDAGVPCKALLLERILLKRSTVVLLGLRRWRALAQRITALNAHWCANSLPDWMFEGIQLPALSSFTGLDALDRVVRELRTAKAGTAYFAHLMLPHSPFLFRADCSMRQPAEWPSPEWMVQGAEPRGPAASAWTTERLTAYHEQVQCLHDRLSRLLEELQSRPEAVWVVLHGDHGSRVLPSTTRGLELSNPESFDLVHGFSAWFSVKAPHIAPGYDPSPVPLEELLLATVIERRLPASGTTPTVYLEKENGSELREFPIPDWSRLLAPRSGVPERPRLPSESDAGGAGRDLAPTVGDGNIGPSSSASVWSSSRYRPGEPRTTTREFVARRRDRAGEASRG